MKKIHLLCASFIALLVTFSVFLFSDGYSLKKPPYYDKIFENGSLLIMFFVSSVFLAINQRRGRNGQVLFVGILLLFNVYSYGIINELFVISKEGYVGWISAIVKLIGYSMVIYSSTSLYLEIKRNMQDVKKDNKKLKESVYIDSLTGLYNRKYLDDFLLSKEYIDNKKDYSLLILDIDDFKSVNDTYGHKVGDDVIEACGASILTSIRDDSIGIRYGGEEFIILSKCKINIPEKIAKRVSLKFNRITGAMPEIEGSKTMSIGIASFSNKDFAVVFENADKALYEAKNTGKNKTVFYK